MPDDELETLRKDCESLNETVIALYAKRLVDAAKVAILLEGVAQLCQYTPGQNPRTLLNLGTSDPALPLQEAMENQAMRT